VTLFIALPYLYPWTAARSSIDLPIALLRFLSLVAVVPARPAHKRGRARSTSMVFNTGIIFRLAIAQRVKPTDQEEKENK
jgi:hypothetical protein